MPDSPTTEPESDFVCDCEEWWRPACAGEPFYKEHEGKRYCVLHYPGKDKSVDFAVALQRKRETKDFNFVGVWFPDEVSFFEFNFSRPADFRSATFSSAAGFSTATFSATADFSGATFIAVAKFRAATFSAAADFSGARFSAEANFPNATFNAVADFSRGTFGSAAYFSDATFGAKAYFNAATFSAAYFSSATFSAAADFGGATFSAKAHFSSVTFGAEADFSHTTFGRKANFNDGKSQDAVDFRECSFSGNADFIDATFRGKADFSYSDFRAEANFQAVFQDTANFLYVFFRDEAYFRYAAFLAPINFRSATFKNYVRFGGTEFGKSTAFDFQYARIEKPERVAFPLLKLRPHWFVNVDTRRFDFVNVDWQWASLQIKSEIAKLQDRKVDKPYRVLAITFQNLASNAEENNRYDEASKFRYLAMDTQRFEAWHGLAPAMDMRRLKAWHGLAPWRLSWWYWLASGYGERIFRALIVLIALLFIFAALYTGVGFSRWEPRLASEVDAPMVKRDEAGAPLKFSRALTYSAAVMTFQRPEPRPTTTVAQTIVLLETILGPVQAALLALAIRRKFMR